MCSVQALRARRRFKWACRAGESVSYASSVVPWTRTRTRTRTLFTLLDRHRGYGKGKQDMPSFVCDRCQETLKKPKLDQHAQRCRGASFSCIDCYRSFKGVEYREHYSCITEVEKYEKKKQVSINIYLCDIHVG